MEKLNLLPEQSGYTYKPNKDVVSIDLEGGLSRSRRDVIGASSFVDARWTLSQASYQYFKAFYNAATGKGANPFLIDLLLDQPYLQEFTAKFVPDSFSMETRGLTFFISAQLEVRPIDDSDFDDMILILHDQDDDYLDLLEQLANYDLEI